MGVNAFVLGLANDLEKRCQRLLDLLAEHQPHPDVAEFNQSTINRLRQTRECIRALRDSDLIRHRPLWPYALSDYQDRVQEVALVEQIAVPILLRYNVHDHQCNQLVTVLIHETGYPIELMPVVTATSDQYYWTQPELRVVGMPVGDLEGILGWPDFFHELAHLLLAAWPRFLAGFTATVNRYFQDERDLLADIGGSEHDNQWLAIAQIKWGEKQEGTWRVELAADLLASYLVGPSYGWQHVRLAVNHGNDPYDPSPGHIADHPADQARLDAVLAMLGLLGLSDDAGDINKRWSEMLDIGLHEKPPQGYDLYYPPKLLQKLAQTVFTGCHGKGLVPFTVHQDHANPSAVGLVDQAWRAFNRDPVEYPIWERQAISRLKDSLRTTSDVTDLTQAQAILAGS
jgi:hypothetical protein